MKENKAHTVDTGNTALESETMGKECQDCLAFSQLGSQTSTATHGSSGQKFSLSGESDQPERKP